jgi:plasmid stabilization system protein ParE
MAIEALEIHPAALDEFKSAINWYFHRSSVAADNLAIEIDRAIQLIAASPQSWPAGSFSTRKFVFRRILLL